MAPLTINQARERVVDFTKPFIITGISIMIKKPEKQEFNVFSFMQPLGTNIWFLIFCSYVGVCISIYSVLIQITLFAHKLSNELLSNSNV